MKFTSVTSNKSEWKAGPISKYKRVNKRNAEWKNIDTEKIVALDKAF